MAKSAKQFCLIERRKKALSLRLSGATLEDIADVISKEFNLPSYDRSRCFEDIDQSLKELNALYTHNPAELRRQELERLDDYLLRLDPAIRRGDVKAISLAIKISARRCKMLGLEASIQVQVEEILSGEVTALINGLESLMPMDEYQSVLNAICKLGEKARFEKSNRWN